MRICILQVLHDPFDKRVFQKEAKSLRSAGHEVISIAPSDKPIPDTAGVRFVAIKPAKSLFQRFISIFRLLRCGLRAKADVYFCVEPESWVAALLIKLISGKKIVFDVHEHVPSEFAKFFPGPLRSLVTWMTIKAMRIMARFTDYIVLTKVSLDAEFAGLSVPRTVVLNTNSVKAPCENIPQTIKDRYQGRPTVIHEGIFGDVRGSYQLLDAMKILAREIPDIRCILLGDYVYGSESEYRRAVNKAGLNKFIEMPGPVAFEDVPAYIAASRVGLILFQPYGMGHTLGMPHKMFDYMREGLPYVAPDFAIEIRRITEEADCGVLVDITKPEEIAHAVATLLKDVQNARRLGANGRRAVETKYNWENDAKILLSVFEALK